VAKLDKNTKEAIGLLSIGTFLEYFDLMLYIHMAVLLNELFFPKTDPFTASLITAFSFCSTYVLRPFAALIFGWIGDNIGRRTTLIITTFLMSISCLIMVVVPTYAQIGIAATWIITICRVIQGMSSMGERVGAEIYLTEITTPPKQYPIVTLIAGFGTLGMFAALGVATFVTSYGMNWRYAFGFGISVALIGAVARTRLKETLDFVDFKKYSRAKLEQQNIDIKKIEEALDAPIFTQKVPSKTSWALFFIQCAYPIGFYFIYGYCSDILKVKFHLPPEAVIQNNLIVSLFELVEVLIILPILSYYIYPLKIMRVKLVLFFAGVVVCPYLLSIATSSYDIFLVQVILTCVAIGITPATAIIYQHFPIARRFTYAAFIYALARAIMYIITSFAIIYLVDKFGYYGIIIIMLPIILGYMFGLDHFEKLEKECGNYPEGWFNISSK
jgi:MHS family proline/betaine transporter-like MFS transporter